ncbi:MAG TPA: trigger factor, partial [Terriglobales bacterium]|nr:trigger factor [Terriglobales bacterium]
MNLKIEVHPIDGVKRRVCVEVDAGEVSREFDRAYADMSRTVSVPGFRRGRVPRPVLERRYGQQVSADVFDRLIRSSLVEAIQRENLHALGHPQISTQTALYGQPLRYEATVEVPPQIDLGDYAGIPVERPLETITDEDVERTLAGVRENLAQLLPVDDRTTVANGDVVMVDYEVRRGTEVLGKGDNRQVIIGAN